MHRHRTACQRVPPTVLRDLQHPLLQHYGVVLVHGPFVLHTAHPLQIPPPRTEKARDSKKVTFALEFAYACSGEVPGGA